MGMGKWFAQAREIDFLRQEVKRLEAESARQRMEIDRLKVKLRDAVEGVYGSGVSAHERELVAQGRIPEAVASFRSRMLVDLETAKRVMEQVRSE